MTTEEFDQEAINDIADIIEENIAPHEESGGPVDNNMINALAETCNKHGINGPEERIDFCVAGVRRFFDREKEQVASDFRESLEAQYRFLGYDI